MSTVFMAGKLYSSREVSGDTIKGAVSVYLLIGLLWTLFYMTVDRFDPGAFSMSVSGEKLNLFYYSFVTMTTLGYGDIVPVNRLARNMAVIQAVLGQMYIAILVARLVGLHIVHQLEKR